MRKFLYIFVLVLVMATGISVYALANNGPQIDDVNDPAYASDSIDNLKQNKNFSSAGLEAKELKEQIKIKRDEAINTAKDVVGSDVSQEAQKVTAVKAFFTDHENTELIEKNIELKDYPVWIVTFHGVKIKMHSAPQGYTGDTHVFADKNVIVDAQTGEVLESVSYSK
ncbi:MAG: hypothetical protein RO469_00905 [Thermincola sp.]|jgi:hypothetical protein|nr:hypothetical protein [Thermincola sp.]MDT3701541.1 hypothetical protein [Thermincola sp.]